MATRSTITRQSSREAIRELQRSLALLGFNPGRIDGVLGRRTRAAITAFQKANELETSGKASPQTQRTLYSGTAEGASRLPRPRPELPAQKALYNSVDPRKSGATGGIAGAALATRLAELPRLPRPRPELQAVRPAPPPGTFPAAPPAPFVPQGVRPAPDPTLAPRAQPRSLNPQVRGGPVGVPQERRMSNMDIAREISTQRARVNPPTGRINDLDRAREDVAIQKATVLQQSMDWISRHPESAPSVMAQLERAGLVPPPSAPPKAVAPTRQEQIAEALRRDIRAGDLASQGEGMSALRSMPESPQAFTGTYDPQRDSDYWTRERRSGEPDFSGRALPRPLPELSPLDLSPKLPLDPRMPMSSREIPQETIGTNDSPLSTRVEPRSPMWRRALDYSADFITGGSRQPYNFSIKPSATLKGVDPRLIDAMDKAVGRYIAANPGHSVEMISGSRLFNPAKGTRNHPLTTDGKLDPNGIGRALDFEITDENGKKLPKQEYGPSFRNYEQLMQAGQQELLQIDPALAAISSFGGYFGSGTKYDQMHIDVAGNKPALGDWKEGLTAAGRQGLTGVVSVGMGEDAYRANANFSPWSNTVGRRELFRQNDVDREQQVQNARMGGLPPTLPQPPTPDPWAAIASRTQFPTDPRVGMAPGSFPARERSAPSISDLVRGAMPPALDRGSASRSGEGILSGPFSQTSPYRTKDDTREAIGGNRSSFDTVAGLTRELFGGNQRPPAPTPSVTPNPVYSGFQPSTSQQTRYDPLSSVRSGVPSISTLTQGAMPSVDLNQLASQYRQYGGARSAMLSPQNLAPTVHAGARPVRTVSIPAPAPNISALAAQYRAYGAGRVAQPPAPVSIPVVAPPQAPAPPPVMAQTPVPTVPTVPPPPATSLFGKIGQGIDTGLDKFGATIDDHIQGRGTWRDPVASAARYPNRALAYNYLNNFGPGPNQMQIARLSYLLNAAPSAIPAAPIARAPSILSRMFGGGQPRNDRGQYTSGGGSRSGNYGGGYSGYQGGGSRYQGPGSGGYTNRSGGA